MKKKKRRTFRINTTSVKPSARQYTLPHIAKFAMDAEKELTPLIRAQQMSIAEAFVLITMRMNTLAWGDDHTMTEDAIRGFYGLILTCWKEGLFTPSVDFPFTLDQVLAEWDDELPDINQYKRQVL